MASVSLEDASPGNTKAQNEPRILDKSPEIFEQSPDKPIQELKILIDEGLDYPKFLKASYLFNQFRK